MIFFVKLLWQYLTSSAYQQIQMCDCYAPYCTVTIYLFTVCIVLTLRSLGSILCAHSLKDESTMLLTSLLIDHSVLTTCIYSPTELLRVILEENMRSAIVYLNCKPLLLLWVTSLLQRVLYVDIPLSYITC